MKEIFTVSRARVASTDRDTLRREILSHTGSDNEVASILRSLERLGSDRSIGYFEMTPVIPKRAAPGAPATLWSIRAVRA